MSRDIRAEAEALAKRRYTEVVTRDVATTGEIGYFAYVVELRHCNAQGETADEARAELQAAKEDYIESLLERGLPVPDPNIAVVAKNGDLSKTIVNMVPELVEV